MLAAAFWLTGFAFAGIAAYELEHPRFVASKITILPPMSAAEVSETTGPAQAEKAEPVPITMPPVTITATRHGTTNMQPKSTLVIGPGTVTHPATIPTGSPQR